MKYSICIPTHNNSNTIEVAIDSAINQVTLADYEILVSDTSEDNRTQEILKIKGCEKLQIFRNPSEWDMWDNHNFLLEKANGDYIVFIHSDDRLLDNALERYDYHLNKLGYPKRIVLCGNSLYKSWVGVLKHCGLERDNILFGSDAISPFLLGGLTPSGTIYSSKFKDEVGFLQDHMIPPYSDCISMLKCAFKGYGFIMVNDIFFVRVCNGTEFPSIDERKKEDMYNLLVNYFTRDELRIIENKCFSENSRMLLKFLELDPYVSDKLEDEKKKKIVSNKWNSLKRAIKHILERS